MSNGRFRHESGWVSACPQWADHVTTAQLLPVGAAHIVSDLLARMLHVAHHLGLSLGIEVGPGDLADLLLSARREDRVSGDQFHRGGAPAVCALDEMAHQAVKLRLGGAARALCCNHR